MEQSTHDNSQQPTRRQYLRTAAGIGVASVVGLSASGTAQAAGGDEQWRFETGSVVFPSPTVVDGTVFVGSNDNNLYAVDAGVSGSSEGSRVMLGTLGHHDERRMNTETDSSSGSGPGFGVGGALAALGGGSYLLHRRRGDEDTES